MQTEPKHPLIRLMTASLGITALGITMIGLAVPGAASDPKKSDGGEHVIVHMFKHQDGKAPDEDRKIVAITSGCEGQEKRIDTETVTKSDDGKEEKTRIVMCNMGGADDGDLIGRLEKARARIAGETTLSEAARAKALAALDREIATIKDSKGFSRQ
jgi:hypothetical protein